MRRIILPFVACEALLYFPTDFINDITFGIKKSSHKMCVFPLPMFSEAFLILKNSERYCQTVYMASCKVPIINVRFKGVLNFFDIFSKISNDKFHENPTIGSRVVPCGQTDGQT